MRIRILGAGWYGCHIARVLIERGHDVEIHEVQDRIFSGASGSIPARCHLGFHYPRSRMTRAACQEHVPLFMEEYGGLTHSVPVNIYAIANTDSLVDYDQYVRTLTGEVPFIPIDYPDEFGLCNVEGAILTGERHIVTDRARAFFEGELDGHILCGLDTEAADDPRWQWTIDCTFGANSQAGVDRYEPCLVLLMRGPVDRAITIMDGGFSSLYPWDEAAGLCSLSSARFTPFSKSCTSWSEANALIQGLGDMAIDTQARRMIEQMAEFYPAIENFKLHRRLLSIRAIPKSAADTRLVDIAQVGERVLRVRAGKIDSVIHAGKAIMEMIK